MVYPDGFTVWVAFVNTNSPTPLPDFLFQVKILNNVNASLCR